MEITNEQVQVLEKIARIAGIHDFMKSEFGEHETPVLIGTVITSVSGLASGSISAKQPWTSDDYARISSQVGSIFITMINLCGSLGVDALTLIDDEFTNQKSGLETQKAAMAAFKKSLEGGQVI